MLLQEHYAEEPWKVLVCCILLNQTGRTQVDKVLDAGFFDTYSTPKKLGHAEVKPLIEILTPLGLQNRRTGTLRDFGRAWPRVWNDRKENISGMPERYEIMSLPGCGEYACDSFAIFVVGDYTKFTSGDKEIKNWLEMQVLEMDVQLEEDEDLTDLDERYEIERRIYAFRTLLNTAPPVEIEEEVI